MNRFYRLDVRPDLFRQWWSANGAASAGPDRCGRFHSPRHRYEGLDGKPDKIVGGGEYVKQYGKGQEVCNFLPCKDGYVYGHVETIKKDIDRQIKIENILGDSNNTNAESVNGIDVVWIATNPDEGGRRA